VHKLAGPVTSNLDFKVTIYFDSKYLENGTREYYTYNGRLKGSRVSYHIISPRLTKAPLIQCSTAPYNTIDRVE